MPELPEVETIRAQLDPHLRALSVLDAWAFPSPKFDQAPAAIGSVLRGVRRRGKYLLVDLDAGGTERELVVHLGMTGRLWVGPRRSESAHLRATWTLSDGRTLHFDDVRRFGRIAVVGRGQHDDLPTLAALGPEPFDEAFSPERLRLHVNRSSRAVKTHLLAQRVVAGVGNIYADEALWHAGVHPSATRLTRAAATRLRDAVRQALQHGLDNGGTTLRNYRDAEGGEGHNQHRLQCYGRAGAPCRRCDTVLSHAVVDARSSTFCSRCQPRSGRPSWVTMEAAGAT